MLRYRVTTTTTTPGNSINIQVPLESNFDIGLNKSALINEKYFERIKENLLPSIVDMEKVVLYPAVYRKNGDGTVELDLANEIEINFHFRNRFQKNSWDIINGWSTNDTLGWNLEFFADSNDDTTTPEYTSENGKHTYNTGSTEFDSQSDLIGVLGFSNDDIKYQKSKVKQSFLRLMYYDSKDPFNRGLIAYSTSFLDTNKLFTKYTNIINNDEFIDYYNGNKTLFSEDSPKNSITCFEPRIVSDAVTNAPVDYKSLRLSTQITLKSKQYTDASSDGFYLYLFKMDAPTKVSKRLYLKGEFNNAGFGKTVSLVVPNKTNDDGSVEILRYSASTFPQDYTETYPLIDSTGGTITNGGVTFNFDKFNNDSYLPVECVYDETKKKYLYYFPWAGATNDFENKKITINFWEPRLKKGEEQQ